MKNKFLIYPSILLFIAFNNFSLLNLKASQNNIDKKISVEYFEQLPTNDYIIGPGDKLSIIIARNASKDIDGKSFNSDLSAIAKVDGEGTINLPKLERVYVNGLTINELNLLLNEAYLKFLKFPKVETTIIGYRPIRVFVEGEVVNPGIQLMDGALSTLKGKDNEIGSNLSIFSNISNENNNFYFPTVFDAIRSSGGITQYSDMKNVMVIRKNNISNGSGKIKTTLNFEDLLKLGENSQNIRIYDSDVIRVQRAEQPNKKILAKAILSNLNPRFIKVFVSGRVNRPGTQTLSRASVLSDAVDMAGGAKILRGKVSFIRFESDGSIDKRKLRFTKNKRGQYNNPNLRNGDLIIVGENVLTSTNEVIKEFTSPFVGIFSTYGLIKAITE